MHLIRFEQSTRDSVGFDQRLHRAKEEPDAMYSKVQSKKPELRRSRKVLSANNLRIFTN